MDAKDVRIFCEMAFKDPNYGAPAGRHASPSLIASKLRLDEKTVRLRIKKMEGEGFIKYYQATPDLAFFGLKCLGLYRFEAMNLATKFGVLRHIRGLPGVVEAFDYIGPTVSVSIAGASPTKVQDLSDEIAGMFELSKLSLENHVMLEPHLHPDRLDWQVIKKLRYDARCTAKQVADALSITPRMAGYRIDKLLQSGAVLMRAVINTQKQEGLVFYELTISVGENRQSAIGRRLREMYGEKLWSMRVSANGVLIASLFAFTLGEPEEAAMQLSKTEGVKSSSVLILKEVVEPARPNWIDALIQEEIAPTLSDPVTG